MDLYLPIAGMTINVFVLIGLGGLVGVLSGLFGVGGGFLITPLLMMLGISSPVAAATGANQIIAASISGTMAHMRRGNVDFKMGGYMVVGGLVGSKFGVGLVSWLKAMGNVDFVIVVLYVVLLGVIGSLMFVEGVHALRGTANGKKSSAGTGSAEEAPRRFRLPLQTDFPTSGLRLSLLVPLLVGVVVGVLAAIMGVGGGFIMVPAMIYLIGMPTQVVVGTSLFQILFTTANTTFWQAVQNHAVDVVLALPLILSAVISAQIGTRMGAKLQGEQLRILLALIVLATAFKLVLDLVLTPANPFAVAHLGP
ncbi:MAG TPA: sulfite exporter TauE/SafE family protein [Gammaproteobacteria bacterium]|nr:sulfite exporter TauE/SafE family protein [Gammaproteobacteria bacterium]